MKKLLYFLVALTGLVAVSCKKTPQGMILPSTAHPVPKPGATTRFFRRPSSRTCPAATKKATMDGMCGGGKSYQPVNKRMSMSVKALEDVLGYRLFPNLDNVIGKERAAAVNMENPQSNSWWWE